MNEPDQINSLESPRQIIFEDFQIDLPISGGWGYEISTACIINKDDPTVDREMPFNGVAFEYVFVEKRIYEEMIIFRDKNEAYAGIRWELEKQELLFQDDRVFDKLIFNIIGFTEEIWDELTSRFDAIERSGKYELIEDLNLYRESKALKLKREFYFDITSFY